MAYIRSSSASDANTTYQQKIAIDGMTYQPSTYYQVDLYNDTTGAYVNAKVNGGGSSPNYFTTAFTFSTQAGTTNYYRALIRYQSGNATTTLYFNMTSPSLPTPPSTPSIALLSENGKTVTLRAYISSNTEYVEWDDTRWAGGSYKTVYTYGATYTDRTFTVPATGQSYSWDIRAVNSVGGSSWSSLFTWTPKSPPAVINVSISDMGGQAFNANLSGGLGTESIHFEVREGGSTGTTVYYNSSLPVGTKIVNVTGLKEYTTYWIRTFGKNSVGSGTETITTTKTLDKTLPFVSITGSSGQGKVYFDFGGYDVVPTAGGSASGLNAYAVWISSKNSTSLGSARHATVTDLDLSYFTFETDADGLNFVHDATYTMGVRSIDVAGNLSALSTVTVQYKKTRPVNWNWITQKYSGMNANTGVTAVEWESLGKAINQFRTYKTLVVRDFIVPQVGDVITATIFNQYCNGIRDMNPPTSPPSNKSTGDSVNASDFNLLTSALNSIS